MPSSRRWVGTLRGARYIERVTERVDTRMSAEGATSRRREAATRAEPAAIRVVVNGEAHAARRGASLDAFLRDRGLDPDLVVVERNGAIVPRRAFDATPLEADDALEIVHFVGGG